MRCVAAAVFVLGWLVCPIVHAQVDPCSDAEAWRAVREAVAHYESGRDAPARTAITPVLACAPGTTPLGISAREEAKLLEQQLAARAVLARLRNVPRPDPRTVRGSMENFQRWMHARWMPWMADSSRALRDLEAALSSLAGAHPSIAADAALVIAGAYADFVAGVRAMPVPRTISGDPDLDRIWRSALENATQGLVEQARSRLEYARSRGAIDGYRPRAARVTAAWLELNAPPAAPSP